MSKYIPLIIVSLLILSCPANEPGSAEISVHIPADFAGMCHSGYSNNLVREYEMLNEMGVVWLHRDFSWSGIQGEAEKDKPPEQWNWTNFDNYVERANTEKKKIMGMLLYDVDWVHDKFGFPRERRIREEELPYYVKYAEETVKRYNGKNGHGKVDAWLIWNEPDLSDRFWEGTKEEFFALTGETASRIRELDKREGTMTTLIGGVFSPLALNDDAWITGLFQSGAMDNVDFVSFHPYSITPESSANVFNVFKKKVTPYDFADKIYINEMGYPTYSEKGSLPAGRYGTDQWEGNMPEAAVKTFALLAAGGARNLTWYHLFDGANRDNNDSEDWFGLVWRKSADEWERKGGYWGYAISATHIPGKIYKEKKFFSGTVPANIKSAYFEGHDFEDGNAFIVWNDSPLRPAEITITLNGSNHKLWDIASGESKDIAETSTHTLYPANTAQKTLIFITWQE
jgi:hypothetical protein